MKEQRNPREIRLEECGCCDCYHLHNFHGDCRDDANRVPVPEVTEGKDFRIGHDKDGWCKVELVGDDPDLTYEQAVAIARAFGYNVEPEGGYLVDGFGGPVPYHEGYLL